MDVKVGQEITLGAGYATAQQIVVTDGIKGIDSNHIIKVTSGTCKFGVDGVGGSQYGYPSGDKTVFFCKNGQLYVTGASATDKFVINMTL